MENTDEIAEKKISVTVKSLSRKELFEAESTWTVTHFKEIISPRFDQTPVDQLTLIFAGKILKDSTTLDENKIRDGLTVHLVMRAKKEAEEAVEPNVGSGITEQPSIRATLLGNLESSLPPMVGDLLNSREALRLWELASNPAVADEMAHMQDRALRNIESIPGGYGALQRLYHEVQVRRKHKVKFV